MYVPVIKICFIPYDQKEVAYGHLYFADDFTRLNSFGSHHQLIIN